MGIPAPAGVGASGIPPAGDQANAVVQGTFAAAGVSQPFAIYGAFNFCIWGTTVVTLTTTNGSSNASVSSGTGIKAGQTVNSVNVPPGTVWATFSGTSGTLAFASGYTNANVVTGADTAAIVATTAWAGTVQLERSFDGGKTYFVCGVGGVGQGAIYSGATMAGQAVSIVGAEPEKGVLYRANCILFTSGTINYRISTTGLAAMAWGIPVGS